MQYFHASHVSCAVSWSSLVAPGFGFGFVASVGGGEGRGGEGGEEEGRKGVDGSRGMEMGREKVREGGERMRRWKDMRGGNEGRGREEMREKRIEVQINYS